MLNVAYHDYIQLVLAIDACTLAFRCVTLWLEVKRSLKANRYGPPHSGTHRVGTRTPKRDGVQRRPSIIKKVWDPLPAVKAIYWGLAGLASKLV